MVVFLSVFLSTTLLAQDNNLTFDHYTVENGLSQSTVLSIAQDSTGYMWFGTRDGLNRFDGQNFEIYRNNSSEKASLSNSLNIGALLCDSKGRLWVGTQMGLNQFMPESNGFIRYINQPNNPKSISGNFIRCIYEDRQHNIWLGTDNGLNELQPDGSFRRFFTNNKTRLIIKTIFQDSKGNLWIGTDNGLIRMSFANNTYKYVTFLNKVNDENSLAENDVFTIAEDLNQNIWIGTHFKGMDMYDPKTNNFKHFRNDEINPNSLVSNILRKIVRGKDGKLWIATLKGLSIYDPLKKTFHQETFDSDRAGSLNQNSIYDIYQDKNGSVWLGSYFGGINVYHPNVITFKKYQYFSYKNSISSNVVSAIAEDQEKNLWVGTEAEGLNHYDRKTQTFKSFKANSSEASVSSNLIKAIGITKKGDLWIAAYQKGVDFYDRQTKKFKNYKLNPAAPNNVSYNNVSYLYIDKQERLWAGTGSKGLFLYRPSSDDFLELTTSKAFLNLQAESIRYIFQDSKFTLWVATDLGVYYLPSATTTFKKFDGINKEFFNSISCISEVGNSNIWFGSDNMGVGYYEKAGNKFTTFSGRDIELPIAIASIVEDNEGSVWVSTNKGLLRYKSGKFNFYTNKDGLPGNVFTYHSFLKDSKGELFFGGFNGMVSFNPSGIKENQFTPQVVFTNLRLFDKQIKVGDGSHLLPKAFNNIPELVFAHQQNIFSIDFAALNFVRPSKNQYAYKLAGIDQDWHYIKNPRVTFTNLPSGDYKLLVKASNNDGSWNEHPRILRILVKPPFWLSVWAYLFYILCLVGVFYMINKYLVIRALMRKESEMHQSKLDFFTNVSHEIRTPLTLILGPLEKMIQETNNNFSLNKQLLIVNKNAKRLMRLVNELMDFRKIESGKMKLNLSEDNVVAFLHEIYISFQQLSQQNKVDYAFITDQQDIKVYFDKEQLEKVIFNLLSNAFKFTAQENAKVSIAISHEEQHVFIRIKDNGKGIPDENRDKLFTDFYQIPTNKQRNVGTGIGLALSKSIAKLHHGDLVLEQSEGNTTFCLSLVTSKLKYKPEEINTLIPLGGAAPYQISVLEDQFLQEESKKKRTVSSNFPLLLVVDDNQEITEFIVNTLIAFYQVVSANNGKDALAIAFEKIPDVIISDVMMPEMDGFELCETLKVDIRTRHIPVVLLTARSSELHELEGLKTGADVYLTKPFSTTKLKLIVDNLVSLHQNMREKFSRQFSLEPTDLQIESSDEEFLNKVLLLLNENIDNSEFNVNFFASEIGMSTPVFYKKINALTGLTVNNFIKSIRLKRALQLLQQKSNTVSEVCYMVGYTDVKYFSKEFKKQFGKPPSFYN